MRVQLVGVKPWSDWVDGKPGKRRGTTYTLIRLKQRGAVLVDLKLPGVELISQEELKAHYDRQETLWVELVNYEEDSYVSKAGKLVCTGTADSIKLVDTLDMGPEID